jgi:membrane-bound lytic murein transglycosylase B
VPSHDPHDRVVIARIAANSQWAQECDRTARTATARAAFLDRFEKQVDPDGVMDLVTRVKAAENARRAYFQRLGRRSGQARAKAKSLLAEADAADRDLAEAQSEPDGSSAQ